MQPGVIPLRPLTLSDLYNGAVGYIRANPKATLGLTAIFVVVTQALVLLLQIGPLGALSRTSFDTVGERASNSGWADLANMSTQLVSSLGGLVLTGMLTVVVGRAVFGASITIGEAWDKVRGRVLALIGLVLLEGLAAGLIVGAAAGVGMAVYAATGRGGFGAMVTVLLLVAAAVAVVYLFVMLVFAAPVIVLERLSVIDAIKRSFSLVRNSFWRIFGIELLTGVITGLAAAAIAVPFGLVGGLVGRAADSVVLLLLVATIGAIIGQIIVQPFSAGVRVLLYTDRRIRAEAFDLVLQTGATGGPAAAESADNLWLAR